MGSISPYVFSPDILYLRGNPPDTYGSTTTLYYFLEKYIFQLAGIANKTFL